MEIFCDIYNDLTILTGEGYFCEHCGKRCCHKGALRQHIRIAHKNEALNLKCKYCDKVFKDYGSRIWHTNVVHFPDKWKCTICQQSCPSQGEDLHHFRVEKLELDI